MNLTDFDKDRLDEPGAIVIDFWAPWCAPCKMMEPTFESLEEDYRDKIDFFKVNVDQSPVLASRYSIRSIPTMVMIKDGEVQDFMVGVVPKSQIEESLGNLI